MTSEQALLLLTPLSILHSSHETLSKAQDLIRSLPLLEILMAYSSSTFSAATSPSLPCSCGPQRYLLLPIHWTFRHALNSAFLGLCRFPISFYWHAVGIFNVFIDSKTVRPLWRYNCLPQTVDYFLFWAPKATCSYLDC